MATLYKKQGWWYIDYFIEKKKKLKNTKLRADESNRQKAEELKQKLENVINARNSHNKSVSDILTDEINLNKAIKLFENIYIKGKSQSHVDIFNNVMNRFKEVVPGNINVKNITSKHISDFSDSLKEKLSQSTKKKLSQSAQVTYFQYVASLLNFLKESNYISNLPNINSFRPKRAKKNIINFSTKDLKSILHEARKWDVKYYNAFMMFLLTGQRPGDVLRLQIGNFDFERNIIYFNVSKTKGEFKFPIYSRLRKFLIHQLQLSNKNDMTEYLFPGLTVHAVGIAFRKIKKRLGLNEYHHYTLKTFRKNFATDMSAMGMTIQEVQALLDHKDPATTLRYYANVMAEKFKEKIDKLQSSSADNIADKI